MYSQMQQLLYASAEESYKQFQCRLMPQVLPQRVLGVRTPKIRALAKTYAGTKQAEAFLNSLPHQYYEEDNLHAFLIERIHDFDVCMEKTCRFLPYIDNWATCDSFSPKVFARQPEKLRQQILLWLSSDQPFVIRYAIGMLMRHFLDDRFSVSFLDLVAEVECEEYYVQMMVAWYFATALCKQYEDTVSYLQKNKLCAWTHNKTIQKAIESYRISDEKKAYLRTLRRKTAVR